MMDDIKHYAKYAGLWLTTRGIISLTVLAATLGFGISGYIVPLITMPIGLGMAVYLTNDRSNYLKTRMKNAYKPEISALLGKDPKEVTVEDLIRVAGGDRSAGLPGNAILGEQLERIDKLHTLSLMSVIGGIGIAALAFFAIVGGNTTELIDKIQHFLQPLIDHLPVHDPKIFSAGLLAGGLSFTGDHLLHHIGMGTMGLKTRTTYDMIQDLKRQQREGVAVTPEQVLGIFITRDPPLNQHITATYGVPYAEMLPILQTDVLSGLEQRQLIVNVTDKINAGLISLNELAFLAEAQHSGLPERTERQPISLQPALSAVAIATVKPAALRIAEVIDNMSEAVNHAGEAIDRITSGMETGDKTPARSFAERYRHSEPASGSFVDRVRKEAAEGQRFLDTMYH